jgi:hypothetical protein
MQNFICGNSRKERGHLEDFGIHSIKDKEVDRIHCWVVNTVTSVREVL